MQAFSLNYMPLRVVKSQALANFLAEHLPIEVNDPLVEANCYVHLVPWILTFDGSRSHKGAGVGVGITVTSPKRKH